MKQIFREIKNSNYKKCKSILLENYSEIHARDDFDNTPLHLAVKNSNYDICKLLLEFGADVNACDQWGNCPLHIATQWTGSQRDPLNSASGVDWAREHMQVIIRLWRFHKCSKQFR